MEKVGSDVSPPKRGFDTMTTKLGLDLGSRDIEQGRDPTRVDQANLRKLAKVFPAPQQMRKA